MAPICNFKFWQSELCCCIQYRVILAAPLCGPSRCVLYEGVGEVWMPCCVAFINKNDDLVSKYVTELHEFHKNENLGMTYLFCGQFLQLPY